MAVLTDNERAQLRSTFAASISGGQVVNRVRQVEEFPLDKTDGRRFIDEVDGAVDSMLGTLRARLTDTAILTDRHLLRALRDNINTRWANAGG